MTEPKSVAEDEYFMTLINDVIERHGYYELTADPAFNKVERTATWDERVVDHIDSLVAVARAEGVAEGVKQERRLRSILMGNETIDKDEAFNLAMLDLTQELDVSWSDYKRNANKVMAAINAFAAKQAKKAVQEERKRWMDKMIWRHRSGDECCNYGWCRYIKTDGFIQNHSPTCPAYVAPEVVEG